MNDIAHNEVFAAFETGEYIVPEGEKDCSALPWNNHPTFKGVALKHLVTAGDSGVSDDGGGVRLGGGAVAMTYMAMQ
jgi:hypothetical protein